VVAVPRPGYDAAKLTELPSQIREKLFTLNAVMPDISATDIRARVARGESVRYRIPLPVETYIKKRSIYAASGGDRL